MFYFARMHRQRGSLKDERRVHAWTIMYLWLVRWGQESCGLRFDSLPHSSTGRSLQDRPLRRWRQHRTWCPTLHGAQKGGRSTYCFRECWRIQSNRQSRGTQSIKPYWLQTFTTGYGVQYWWFCNVNLEWNHIFTMLTLYRAAVQS